MIYIRLSRRALRVLLRQAAAQRRSPQDEAGLIVERTLGTFPAEEGKPGSKHDEDLPPGCGATPNSPEEVPSAN